MTGKARQRQEATSPLEWAVAALGGVLLALGIGYMVYYGFAYPAGTARIAIEVVSIGHDGTSHQLRFVARNSGHATAAQLAIRGELRDGDTIVEESETVLDFLPQQSQREGTLLFGADPQSFDLTIRPLGYRDP